ncbi:hypothetical protein M6D81_09805 [Paenibacillus sp. J5C_2022]|uniref:hypothetical protein n=1 Tax=Paenibacillus sp. J5C2022 TaxID=2977129 RepID=UPI0021D18A8A|nr:hypothetical protein [Paenibacillus sp. J5C2022]MCU6709014.1 hypothetical protein [Paenibacillus sp. J5C2022]
MSKNNTDNKEGLNAEDLALIAAILVVIGDLVALWAVIAARNENADVAPEAASISRHKKKKPRRRA